jgi:hypothetical protein
MNPMALFLTLALLSATATAYPIRPNSYSGGGGFWAMEVGLGKAGQMVAEIGGLRNGMLEHYDATTDVRAHGRRIILEFSPQIRFEGGFTVGGTEIDGTMYVFSESGDAFDTYSMHLQARYLSLPAGRYGGNSLLDLGALGQRWVAMRMDYRPEPGGSGLGALMAENSIVTRYATNISVHPKGLITIRFPQAQFQGELGKDNQITGRLTFFGVDGVLIAESPYELRMFE